MTAGQRPVPALVAAAVMVAAGLSVTATSSAGADQRDPAPPAAAANGPASNAAVVERLTQQAGIQLAAKHRSRPTVTVGGRRYPAPDPLLSQQLSGTTSDYSYWRRHHRLAGLERMRARKTAGTARAVPRPFVYHEQERVGVTGRNDGLATSEHLADLGVDRPFQAARIEGRLSAPPVRARRAVTHEDQGSIYRATPTGIGRAHPRVVVSSRIGDGPHGKAGDGRGDFDFFRVHVFAGSAIAADTAGSKLDTVLVVYDSAGHIVAANDDVDGQGTDDGTMLTSALEYNVRRTGTYFVMVSGFGDGGSVPANPFRSGSGRKAGDEGTYRLRITARPVDRDLYGVQLRSGDLLGGVLTGSARSVQVVRTDGRGMVASEQDASAAYPVQSPLPGGGSAFAYVAQEPGWYAVSARAGAGNYRLLLETYPPGTAGAGQQTIFLDFDGARINTGMFGGLGVVTLSPLRTFLPRWRVAARQLDAVVDATDAAVTENIDATLRARGLNKTLSVQVLNSRDDPDPFGQPNVSRIVVGGTIRQSGVPTIGIAQSIDPGNYAHEESAIVLLDELSRPNGPEDSLNTYLRPRSNRVAFIGQALGNIIAHETGHLLGSFHTNNHDRPVDLMDSGGGNPRRFFGVGPDRIGGTADDTDVNFGEDHFAPDEGFHGMQNSLNNSAWAFVTP
jgi:hypothetical protein